MVLDCTFQNLRFQATNFVIVRHPRFSSNECNEVSSIPQCEAGNGILKKKINHLNKLLKIKVVDCGEQVPFVVHVQMDQRVGVYARFIDSAVKTTTVGT